MVPNTEERVSVNGEAMRSQSIEQVGAQWAVISRAKALSRGITGYQFMAPLTMFTINPLAFARLRPSTLFEFVACSGFSLILCWTFYPHLGWNWEMQHVWKVLSFTWVLKVAFWLVWMEGVLIRGPDDKAISPKIGDKAPPRAACLHPLTTEVWSHIRDLHLRHGQRCQPLSSASSFRDSAKCLCAHCNVVCTLSKPVQQWTYSKQPLIYYAAGNILEFSSSVFLLLPILFTAQDKNHNGVKTREFVCCSIHLNAISWNLTPRRDLKTFISIIRDDLTLGNI